MRRRTATRRWCAAVTTVVLAVGMVACSGDDDGGARVPDPPSTTPEPVEVAAAQATTLDLGGGARLIIPPGAMDPGATVSASYGEPPSDDFGVLNPIAAPVKLVSEPADAIHGLLTLEFPIPLDGDAGAGEFGISTFEGGEWVPVTATVDTERELVVAQIPHFSWWNPFSWDWASLLARTNQRIGEILGKRAPAASCTRGEPQPGWVASMGGITNDGAIAVRACAEGEGDVLAVELVNNRPYSMYLDYGSDVEWGWHEEGDSTFDLARNAFGDTLAGPDRLYLPPRGRASVGILRAEGHHEFHIGYGREAFAVDILATVLDETVDRLPGLNGCEEAIFTTGFPSQVTPGAIRDAVSSLFGCLQRTAATGGALDSATVAQLEAYARNVTVVGHVLKFGSYEWDLLDLYVDNVVVADSGLGAGFSVLGRATTAGPEAGDAEGRPGPTTPPSTSGASHPPTTATTQPATTRPPTTQPVTTRPPTTQPRTYPAQQASRGADSFQNPHNASGVGPRVVPNQWVDVSCKLYDPYIASVNPDGYWYRIASPPWSNGYYVAANTFWNGDTPATPRSEWHNTDFSIPDC